MVFYITKYFFFCSICLSKTIYVKGLSFFPQWAVSINISFDISFDTSGEPAKDTNCYRIPKQTVHFLKHHLGLLIYEARKGNMQMMILICIELIPLTVFLGFLMFSIIFSVYTCRTFFPCQKKPHVLQVSMLSAAWGYRNSECSL